MIAFLLFGLAAAAGPSCSLGDYISTCNFTPAKTSAFRIVSSAEANARGAGPHRLTTEYSVNGMVCRQSEAWPSGPHRTLASCVALLRAGTYYHVVATTNAQNADHDGRVSIRIEPTQESPTLRSAPVSISVKPGA